MPEMKDFFSRFPDNQSALRKMFEELDFRNGHEAKVLRETLGKHLAQFPMDDEDDVGSFESVDDTEYESDAHHGSVRPRIRIPEATKPATPRRAAQVKTTLPKPTFYPPDSPQAQAAKPKVEALRSKLLELSTRNRLISFKHTTRVGRFVRIVDESAEAMFKQLQADDIVECVPLPRPPELPDDERGAEFVSAIEEALLTDKTYLKAAQKIAVEDADDSEAQLRLAERALRDRLRKKLGMPSRADSRLTPKELGERFGIYTDFDLKGRKSKLAAVRPQKQWQTLLEEPELARRLKAIAAVAREARQEFGVETLHLVFGFLEWSPPTTDGEADEVIFSPLVLQPVEIDRKGAPASAAANGVRLIEEDSGGGASRRRESYVLGAANSEPPYVNLSLRERLRQDYKIILPEIDPDEPRLDAFFGQVEEMIRGRSNWRIRKFVTLTHLSFSRLPMWLDLNPNAPGRLPPFQHKLLAEIFGGRQPGEGSSHGDRAEAGSSSISVDAPAIVSDCDSSQHAAIRQALAGKNLVVQGPPGTGKSQTITNLIAAAIAKSLRVLFVAEKQVALEVVHKRLKDAGLEDFVFELHSAKAGKKPILESIKKRIERQRPKFDAREDAKMRERHAEVERQLNEYAALMGKKFSQAGWTIHDIFWQELCAKKRPLPLELANFGFPDVANWTREDWKARKEALLALARAEQELLQAEADSGAQSAWAWVMGEDLHVFERDGVETACRNLLQQAANAASTASSAVWFENAENSSEWLREKLKSLHHLGPRPVVSHPALWLFARLDGATEILNRILKANATRDAVRQAIRGTAPRLDFDSVGAEPTLLKLRGAVSTSYVTRWTFSIAKLKGRHAELEEALSHIRTVATAIEKMRRIPEFSWLQANAEGAKALMIFVKHAVDCPEAIVRRRHELGDSQIVEVLRDAITQGEKLEAECAAVAKRLAFPLTSLDVDEIKAAISEMEGGWALSFVLSPPFRKAVRLLKRIAPEVQGDERIVLLRQISSCLEKRAKFARHRASELIGENFTGLDGTDFSLLEKVCDWVESVYYATPLSEPHGISIRGRLLALNRDLRLEALRLNDERFPVELELLLSTSGGEGSLSSLERNLQEQIATFDFVLQTADNWCWTGPVERSAIEQVIASIHSLREAESSLTQDAEAGRLLSPDLASSAKEMDLVARARKAMSQVGLSDEWFERVTAPDGGEQWARIIEWAVTGETALNHFEQALAELERLATPTAAWSSQVRQSSLGKLTQLLQRDLDALHVLPARCLFNSTTAALGPLGLREFVSRAEALREPKYAGLADIFERLAIHSLSRKVLDETPGLRPFRSLSPETLKAEFVRLDTQLQSQERQKLADDLASRYIPAGVGVGLVKHRTERALLEHVCRQQRPQITVRDLLKRAGKALVALKPCFLMSPLSVAQLIERGTVEFDLVIFDEASQIRPEDAMCALLRAKQFVVVGDKMQLPPTNFGVKGSSATEPVNDEDADDDADNESILDLAESAYGEGVMLRWHYRSRDPSLIAFSNVEFYKRQLLLFPKPGIKEPSSGVSLVRVQGTYGNRINLIEARKCAAEAIAFMRRHPERSLGIVALNRPQADLIEHELDQLIAHDRDAQRYKTKWENSGLEPIFVKNLESVQGDERDTIFISTVFGPDEDGNFMQRFGPINSSVGHRRLNVLFSRAKHQVVVFSSIEPSRILVGPDSHLGVGAFRRYLEFATTGEIASHQITGRSTESFFEQSVKDALEQAGYTCEPQVGVAGFFIDLGVRTQNSTRFLLGVECDGASYHSSPFARDRDRLRQAILENLGWKIHRIWSTDWFRDPKRELNKLVLRLESLAKAAEIHTPLTDIMETLATQAADAEEDSDLAEAVAREIDAEADTRIKELLRLGLVEFDKMNRITVPSYSGDLFSQIRVIEFYNQQCYQWLKKHSLLPWEEMPWPEIRDTDMRVKVRAQAIRDIVARFRS